jgi:hypothetical protein
MISVFFNTGLHNFPYFCRLIHVHNRFVKHHRLSLQTAKGLVITNIQAHNEMQVDVSAQLRLPKED